MILILILAAILIVGIVWQINNDGYDDVGSVITMFISSIFLFVALIAIPVTRMDVMSSIHRFHSIQATAIQGRDNGDGLEGAAFRMEIAEANAWLASAQYWRSTSFWVYWPEEINDIEPIQ
jgi:hypothetical protein